MNSDKSNHGQPAAAKALADLLQGDVQQAIAWAKSISPATAELDTLSTAAQILTQSGNVQSGLDCYQALLQRSPQNLQVLLAIACCHAQLGNREAALEEFTRSGTQSEPASCAAFASALGAGSSPAQALTFLEGLPQETLQTPVIAICRAGFHQDSGNDQAAIAVLRKQLELGIEPAEVQAQAWFNLGVLLESSNATDAEAAFRQAIAAEPNYDKAWTNLAVLLINQDGRGQEAASVLADARQRFPESVSLIYLSGYAQRLAGNLEAAIGELEQLVERTDDHSQGWELLGRCLSTLDRHEQAQQHYTRWLANHPQHPVATHLLAALTGQSSPSRASAQYVSETFDAFAETFDDLLAKLEYQGPALFRDLLAKHYDGQTGQQLHVLDAGCGTGLMGEILRPYASQLIGVDLSSGMLKRARSTQAYDELVCADLEEYLDSVNARFDLIVSSDTFNYFGDLGKLLRVSIAALKPGGILAFSVEQGPLSDDCFRLMPHGRYIHSPHYLVWLLGEQGIPGGTMRKVILRQEEQADVHGLLVIAERPTECV